MQISRLKAIAIAIVAASALGSGLAMADDSSDTAAKDDQWTFTLAPYFWAAGLDGDVGAFGAPPSHVDASFGDIIKDFDIGLMGVGEARHGRFGVFVDFLYIDLETDSVSTPGTGFTSGKLESETLFTTPMLEYRLVDDDWSSLDAMAGMRVWYSKTEIKLTGGTSPGQNIADDATWVDPTIGVRGNYSLGDDWALSGWGIIGGFGVGSDFMWDAFGGVNYSIDDQISLVVGYRGTGTDYASNGYVFDVVLHGPVMGAVFKF